ncbi:hypothetical protein C8R47DRAFT_1259773 [Mycena vitilis]|nr:hypothetical protein C8R47DRAFT_1259773 [Mycena vitilis]
MIIRAPDVGRKIRWVIREGFMRFGARDKKLSNRGSRRTCGLRSQHNFRDRGERYNIRSGRHKETARDADIGDWPSRTEREEDAVVQRDCAEEEVGESVGGMTKSRREGRGVAVLMCVYLCIALGRPESEAPVLLLLRRPLWTCCEFGTRYYDGLWLHIATACVAYPSQDGLCLIPCGEVERETIAEQDIYLEKPRAHRKPGTGLPMRRDPGCFRVRLSLRDPAHSMTVSVLKSALLAQSTAPGLSWVEFSAGTDWERADYRGAKYTRLICACSSQAREVYLRFRNADPNRMDQSRYGLADSTQSLSDIAVLPRELRHLTFDDRSGWKLTDKEIPWLNFSLGGKPPKPVSYLKDWASYYEWRGRAHHPIRFDARSVVPEHSAALCCPVLERYTTQHRHGEGLDRAFAEQTFIPPCAAHRHFVLNINNDKVPDLPFVLAECSIILSGVPPSTLPFLSPCNLATQTGSPQRMEDSQGDFLWLKLGAPDSGSIDLAVETTGYAFATV